MQEKDSIMRYWFGVRLVLAHRIHCYHTLHVLLFSISFSNIHDEQ